jgi:hypothetical protein
VEFVDVLERVLTKGVVFDIEEGANEGSEKGGGTTVWLRVSIGGIDVLKVETALSWQCLSESGEQEKE